MFDGTLISESLRVGTVLEGFPLSVRRITREDAVLSPQQIVAGLPSRWTVFDFEVEDQYAGHLADTLAESLDPGWYANFQSKDEMLVIFSNRIFRYPRGDEAARKTAQTYGRSLGIPEPQLDWTR